jgi:hypothetical protein
MTGEARKTTWPMRLSIRIPPPGQTPAADGGETPPRNARSRNRHKQVSPVALTCDLSRGAASRCKGPAERSAPRQRSGRWERACHPACPNRQGGIDLGRKPPADRRPLQPLEVVGVVVDEAADGPSDIASEVNDRPGPRPNWGGPGIVRSLCSGWRRGLSIRHSSSAGVDELCVVHGAAVRVRKDRPRGSDRGHSANFAPEIRVVLPRQRPERGVDHLRFGASMNLQRLVRVVHHLTVPSETPPAHRPLGPGTVNLSPVHGRHPRPGRTNG